MAQTFAAQVKEWVEKVEGAQHVIFQEACQELLAEMDELLVQMVYRAPPAESGYERTGFLRASVVASKTAMPTLSRAAPGGDVPPPDFGEVALVINSTEPGDVIYLGYTAKYGALVEAGTSKTPPRPWVRMAAQRWQQIVDRVSERVKGRLGL